jgi:NAD(P)-dependent dehydrogenase (short-subunit alcohol dehydrogenase family)
MKKKTHPYFGSKMKCEEEPITFPPQHQDIHPGLEYIMNPRPIYDDPCYKGSKKLDGKVAIITGGDSGIGRAVAVAFAKEGANLAIIYLYERVDALETKEVVESYGGRCILIEGDLKDPSFSKTIVKETIFAYGKIDILVNNAAVQYTQDNLLDISIEQLYETFETNVFSYFYLTQAVLPHLKEGSTIINTASITAYEGNEQLIDYSSTKGAVVTFTRSLSKSLVEEGIRVNGVAPGPIWTPLIPSSYSTSQVMTFGLKPPMKRAGEPYELAPTYVYLASNDSQYVTGQILHVNGGTMVGS